MTVDISTFVLLAIVFLSIALRHRRAAEASDEYHIANWSARPWAVIASLLALFGAGEISTFTDMHEFVGGAILLFFIGVAGGFGFIAIKSELFFHGLRHLRRPSDEVHQAFQSNDVMYDRFGRISMALFTVLAATGLYALFLIQVIVGSELIAVGSEISYIAAVVGITSFIFLYVALSGLLGIYSTDKIQLAALLIALGVITFQVLDREALDISSEWEGVLNGLLDPTIALTLVIPGFFAVVGAADVHQRVVSASSARDLRRIALASSGGWLLLGVLIIAFSAGVAGFGSDDTRAFIGFLEATEGPARVIIIVALVSALLSTADTEAHAIALLIGRAVAPTKKPSISRSRMLVGAVCTTGALLALTFRDLATLYGLLLNISLILGPVILALVFRRGTRSSIMLTMALSVLLFVYYTVSDIWLGTSHFLGLEVLLLSVPTLFNLGLAERNRNDA